MQTYQYESRTQRDTDESHSLKIQAIVLHEYIYIHHVIHVARLSLASRIYVCALHRCGVKI